MGSINKKELKELFARIDRRLLKSIDLFVIGGAAAILGYNVVKETNDVDLDGSVDSELNRIFQEEASSLGLDLFLSSRGVFVPPDGYRERMMFHDFPKKKLRVWTLDQYDLAISKMDRGIGKDFADIRRVHQEAPYEESLLVQIFIDEYLNVSVLGNKREKMMNFLDLIAQLFGDEAMNRVRIQIGF